jgi:putative ABC transport system ATP-binding protein
VERESLTTVMVTHSVQHAVRLGNRVLVMHRGKVVRDFSDARRARLRVEDLLAVFDQLRSEDQLDASAAAMLERVYV